MHTFKSSLYPQSKILEIRLTDLQKRNVIPRNINNPTVKQGLFIAKITIMMVVVTAILIPLEYNRKT
jgi:hypothetical protein